MARLSGAMKRVAVTAAAVLLAAGAGLACAATAHVTLTGSHETPPVKTTARGSGVIEVLSDGSVSGKITTHGIKGTMAHMHEGAPGKKGIPIMPLLAGPHDTWVIPRGSKLSREQYKEFLAGDLYINVHSSAHPGGEIRGQLKP